MVAVDLALWVIQASEMRVEYHSTRDARCVRVAFERVRRPRPVLTAHLLSVCSCSASHKISERKRWVCHRACHRL